MSEYNLLPLKGAIDDYVATGHPVGNFLEALLSNDLIEAVGQADNSNIILLPVYCRYLYNECPSQCHGSPEKYKAWLEGGAE